MAKTKEHLTRALSYSMHYHRHVQPRSFVNDVTHKSCFTNKPEGIPSSFHETRMSMHRVIDTSNTATRLGIYSSILVNKKSHLCFTLFLSYAKYLIKNLDKDKSCFRFLWKYKFWIPIETKKASDVRLSVCKMW